MSEPKFTPGPWRWEINLSSKRIQLCGGVPQYDLIVMDFARWGMSGAAPRLREDVSRMNIMHRVERWAKVVPLRGHHAGWFRSVDHPDMHLIAAAPDLLAACFGMLATWGSQDEDAIIAARDAARAAVEKAMKGGAK